MLQSPKIFYLGQAGVFIKFTKRLHPPEVGLMRCHLSLAKPLRPPKALSPSISDPSILLTLEKVTSRTKVQGRGMTENRGEVVMRRNVLLSTKLVRNRLSVIRARMLGLTMVGLSAMHTQLYRVANSYIRTYVHLHAHLYIPSYHVVHAHLYDCTCSCTVFCICIFLQMYIRMYISAHTSVHA